MKIKIFVILTLITLNPALAQDEKTGLIRNEKGTFDGFTLFTPLSSTSTYLIDIKGNVVHTWQSDHTPGQSVYLLEDGHLLRAANLGRIMGGGTFYGGGVGGGVQKFNWDGDVVWEFFYSDDQHCLHHDIEPMPNGNILMLAWEKKTKEQAIAAGRDPESVGDQLWPDHIIEVKPEGKNGGEVVWQWHVWDHLIQDYDPRKSNYSSIAEHPELIDINYDTQAMQLPPAQLQRLRSIGYVSGPAKPDKRHGSNPDWNHTNSIAYNAELDQIALSVLSFNEVWIIDHSTTIQQAAGHTGGKYGKGGDILYRWGNPQAYKTGTSKDQKLFGQHDVTWIERGSPGAGDLLLFNNGDRRGGRNYSSVDQISPPINKEGGYDRDAGKPFGPKKPTWVYTAENKSDFFSSHISGAQRLPNGNTLVCSGEGGQFFEVTATGRTVWEYISPFVSEMPPGGDMGGPPGMGRRAGIGRLPGMDRPGMPSSGPDNGDAKNGRAPGFGKGHFGNGNNPQAGIFRATRLPKDFAGFAGKSIKVGSSSE
ncbi:MAG: aryl-sulfate sulfotransferase [Sedimentisphaerales bacterium]|nr:aryl-sulfate sulfotransferase [Sedimentisphaerales bacterium]